MADRAVPWRLIGASPPRWGSVVRRSTDRRQAMADYLSPGVYVEEVPPLARPIAGVGTSTPGFIGVFPDTIQVPARPQDGDTEAIKKAGFKWVDLKAKAKAGVPEFITTWTQYTDRFGDFLGLPTQGASTQAPPAVNLGQRFLAQAVYAFFNNGGTGCYVVRVAAATDLDSALRAFAAIDEITMVAAPGLTGATAYDALVTHCANPNLQDRVAILDPVERDATFDAGNFTTLKTPVTATPAGLRPSNSTFAAFYFPWVQVFDPAASLTDPLGKGLVYVPPSGHMAGIYARSDAARGVHKAPANEVVLGATGLRYPLSKADQDQLNDDGVNLIRPLNGAIRVWGARTVGGNANGEFRYLSTRRFFNFLRESIDEGTQFVVFEPN